MSSPEVRETLVSLDAIARDANRLVGLPREVLAAILLRCAAVQDAVSTELVRSRQDDVSERTQNTSTKRLLTAKALAAEFSVPESWIRSEARANHIPKVMMGRYVRFDPEQVRKRIDQRNAQDN